MKQLVGSSSGGNVPLTEAVTIRYDREMMSGSERSIDNGRNGGTVCTVMEREWTGCRLIRLYCTIPINQSREMDKLSRRE